MVLARLLVPQDFGLVAMVTTVMGFLRIFQDAGLSTATVQRQEITHAQVSNLFWVNVALGGIITLLVAGVGAGGRVVLSRTPAYRYHIGAVNHFCARQFRCSTHCAVEPADALQRHRDDRRCFLGCRLFDRHRHGAIEIWLLGSGWRQRDPGHHQVRTDVVDLAVAAAVTLPQHAHMAPADFRR